MLLDVTETPVKIGKKWIEFMYEISECMHTCMLEKALNDDLLISFLSMTAECEDGLKKR